MQIAYVRKYLRSTRGIIFIFYGSTSFQLWITQKSCKYLDEWIKFWLASMLYHYEYKWKNVSFWRLAIKLFIAHAYSSFFSTRTYYVFLEQRKIFLKILSKKKRFLCFRKSHTLIFMHSDSNVFVFFFICYLVFKQNKLL